MARLRGWVGGVLALAASACGGGGGGTGGEGSSVLRIATAQLLVVQPGQPYADALVATGGATPYRFGLAPSSSPLPAGLSLSPSGVLSGVTTAVGSRFVEVEVADASVPTLRASRTLVLQVGGFDVSIDGLLAGDAWSGRRHAVSTSTLHGSVDIRVESSSIGSTTTDLEPTLGRATYVCGPGAGTDVLRLTRANGVATEVTVLVRADPVARMTARFGSTDVWHVAFEGKRDPLHAYETDFLEALALTGLRDPLSLAAPGAPADELADLFVRIQTIREVNALFLNEPDGDAAANGLAISFPFEAPDSLLVPVAGAATPGVPGAWNRVTVHAGNTFSFYGYSIQDTAANGMVENLTTSVPGAPLGVFCDLLTSMFKSVYADWTLPAAPLGAADVPTLEGLLYGPRLTDARSLEIERVSVGFAKFLAFAIAHELGHALGVDHVVSSGSIMDPASIMLPPGTTFSWDPTQLLQLRANLPGPGR
jgi:hypothetical protein